MSLELYVISFQKKKNIRVYNLATIGLCSLLGLVK